MRQYEFSVFLKFCQSKHSDRDCGEKSRTQDDGRCSKKYFYTRRDEERNVDKDGKAGDRERPIRAKQMNDNRERYHYDGKENP